MKNVILRAATEESRLDGSVMLNGQKLPFDTPMEVCDATIDMLKQLKNYSISDTRKLNEYQIMEKLASNGHHIPIDEAIGIMDKIRQGHHDARLGNLDFKPTVFVEYA